MTSMNSTFFIWLFFWFLMNTCWCSIIIAVYHYLPVLFCSLNEVFNGNRTMFIVTRSFQSDVFLFKLLCPTKFSSRCSFVDSKHSINEHRSVTRFYIGWDKQLIFIKYIHFSRLHFLIHISLLYRCWESIDFTKMCVVLCVCVCA